MHYMQKIKLHVNFIEKVFHKYTDTCTRTAYTKSERQNRRKFGNWQILHMQSG